MAEENYTKDYLPYILYLAKRAADRSLSDEETLQAAFDFLEAVDALAEDSLADIEDRKIALKLQAQNAEHFRMHLPEMIAAVAERANTDTVDPEERDKAKDILKGIAEHLKERGTDIGNWVEPTSKHLQ